MSDDSEDIVMEKEEELIEEEIDPLVSMAEKINDLEKELQYSAAEIINIRQRSIRDKNELNKYRSSTLAIRLFPIIDNLKRAIKSTINGKNISDSLIEGLKMTLDGMEDILKAEGVEKINIEDDKFDPSYMESIASISCPDGKNPGDVIEIIEEGYKLHDRVLRAAKVIVAEG